MSDFVPLWRVTRGPEMSTFMAEFPGAYTSEVDGAGVSGWRRTICGDRLRRRMVRAGVHLTPLEFRRAVNSMLKTEAAE